MTVDFKTHINVYLKELEKSPVRSLADIIAFNENNAELVHIRASSFRFLAAPAPPFLFSFHLILLFVDCSRFETS